MTCARARRAILKALADDLTPRRRQRLADHLARCAACRDEARQAGLVLRELVEIPALDPGSLYWEAFSGRVRRRIEEHRAGPAPVAEGFPADPRQEMGCRAAIAAALVATAALGLIETRPSPPQNPAAALVEALQAPGILTQVAPAAFVMEDSDLDIEDSLVELSREDALRLRYRLQRELGLSPLPRKENADGC